MKLACALSGDIARELEYGVLELGNTYRNWLLKMRDRALELKGEVSSFYCISVFDYNMEVFSSLGDKELDEFLTNTGTFCLVPDDFRPNEEKRQRIAAPTALFTDGGVLWHGHPKHGSGEYESPVLLYADLVTMNSNLDDFEQIGDARDLNQLQEDEIE